MTFDSKGLFTLLGFLAIVWLGVYARSGQIRPGWAIVAAAAYVIVGLITFFGIALIRRNTRND